MPDQNDFYREILDYISDGVYFTDTERRIAFWNKGAEALSGYSRNEVIGKCCKDNILMHVDDAGHELCLLGCPLSASIRDGKPREAEVFLHHKNGHRVAIRVRIEAMRNDTGEIVGAVEVFRDNTAHLQLTEKLSQMEKLAMVDSLTGLGNRHFINSVLQSRMEELHRNNWNFGILFADIDDFKTINDQLGHEVGDLVLQMVGRTLNSALRAFDFVGRWGGEEFIAILANAETAALREVGERLRTLVEHSALTEPVPAKVTVSIGGAQALPEDTLESLLRRADEKLYQAKKNGKNRLCI
jgi:diguanylate cyclase (GGDEF)-like protein/PAS domain S-box-containing protein